MHQDARARGAALSEDWDVSRGKLAWKSDANEEECSSPSNSSTKSIEFDRFYGDGSFLKLLQETLQKNATVLQKGTVKLALSPTAIAYLNDRLNNTLCPKPAPDKSGRIEGWTIRNKPSTESFRRVLSPRKSDSILDMDALPVGHLDVLKLSTLLSEIFFLKVKGDVEPTSPQEVHFEIFPNLRCVELYQLNGDILDQLNCFTPQLEVLHCHYCEILSPHEVLHYGTWNQLTSIKFVHCNLETWQPEEMHLAPALGEFICTNNRLHELHNLPASSTLRSVVLSHNRLKMLSLEHNFPLLTSLALDHNELTSLVTLPISNMPHLEHLDVSHNYLQDLSSINSLLQLKRLKSLKLTGNPLSRFPDYRRQVLFILGESVELDDVPWTWTEMDSMRFSRDYKRSKGPLTYPYLKPIPLQLQARIVKIQDTKAPYLATIKRSRTQSNLSESSYASSQRPSITSETDETATRNRAESYHVDEFLRDLADEESSDDSALHVDHMDHILPPTTQGIPATIYLSVDEAENLELPLGQEGIGGLVHITETKLIEYLPGGAIIQRNRSQLLCMALYHSLNSTTMQLGFRNKPTVAYKVGDPSFTLQLVQAIYESMQKKKPLVGYKCKSCDALIISYERQPPSNEPLVITIHKCWICKSSYGREYTTSAKLIKCFHDMGIYYVGEDEQNQVNRSMETMNQQGILIEADYDDGDVERDEIIWIITDSCMKEFKLTAEHQDEDHHPEMEKYRHICAGGI